MMCFGYSAVGWRLDLTLIYLSGFDSVETVLQQKKPSRNSSNIPNINARLEYTSLPLLDPDLPQPDLTVDNLHLAGMYN